MQLLSALRRSGSLRSFTGLWLVAFLSFGPALSAAIRNVPATYPTITAALAASSSGDTIQVAAGTYDGSTETFPLELKDGVAIVGAGAASTTILPDAGVPAFDNEDTPLGPTTRLEGFTITHPAGEDDPLVYFLLGTSSMSPVITNNIFIGNDDETDGAIFIGGTFDGGTFDGQITSNTFTGFGAVESVPPPTVQLTAPTEFNGGGIVIALSQPEIVNAKHGGVATQALPGEDNLAPTISGNTFDGNEIGIAAFGTFYSYDYVASGVVAPVIDGNTFTGDGADVLLSYAGVGAREFSPSVTNNNSTGSFLHVFAVPFFGGSDEARTPGTRAAAAGTTPRSLKDQVRTMRENILAHRMGKDAPRKFAKNAAARAGRVHTNGVPLPATLSDITISGNTATDTFGGVFMYQYMYGGTGLDFRLDISNNEFTNAFVGGALVGLLATEEETPIPDSISIQQNHVTGAGTGLGLSLNGGCGCVPPPAGNTHTSLLVTEPLNDVQVIGNIFENGGTGLEIGSDGYTSLAPLVSCNLIQNNTEGGVIIDDGADPTPDFGGGSRNSPGKNSIHDNTGFDMENDDADLVMAENNWWGTTNPATIEANTIDTTEDPEVGEIDFDPPLAAEATDCIVSSGDADLALVKTVTSTGPYVVGSNITYQLSVTNNGPDGATNVVVTDPLPAGSSFVSASPGCSFAAGTITCTAATLANGASTAFNVTVQATIQGAVVNTATVDSDETDSTPGNSTSTAPAVPVGAAAAAAPIPTTSEWGLMIMGLFLAMTGLWFTRRF